jgi:hypothetical protein
MSDPYVVLNTGRCSLAHVALSFTVPITPPLYLIYLLEQSRNRSIPRQCIEIGIIPAIKVIHAIQFIQVIEAIFSSPWLSNNRIGGNSAIDSFAA